jgi:hypothetical protein
VSVSTQAPPRTIQTLASVWTDAPAGAGVSSLEANQREREILEVVLPPPLWQGIPVCGTSFR